MTFWLEKGSVLSLEFLFLGLKYWIKRLNFMAFRNYQKHWAFNGNKMTHTQRHYHFCPITPIYNSFSLLQSPRLSLSPLFTWLPASVSLALSPCHFHIVCFIPHHFSDVDLNRNIIFLWCCTDISFSFCMIILSHENSFKRPLHFSAHIIGLPVTALLIEYVI